MLSRFCYLGSGSQVNILPETARNLIGIVDISFFVSSL